MRVLALDPGTNFGWATDATGRLEWGCEDFRIRNGESSGNRWMRYGRWLHVITGYPFKEEGFPPETRSPSVSLIVYERAHFMPKARAAAEIAAGFTTRLEEHCERHGIALQPVAVQTLKAFALPKMKRKKGDPKMDRSKAAMILAAGHKLQSLGINLPESHCPACTTATLTEHEADALWLYWWARENGK